MVKQEEFIDKDSLLKDAVNSCLNNVKQYFIDAHQLIENESYGHAFALVVLGEEELSKAFIFQQCLEGLLPLNFLKKMGKGHESHARKHAVFAANYAAFGFLKTLPHHGQPEVDRKKIDRAFQHVLGNIKTLSHSEAEKQMGLYVDLNLNEGIIITPQTISKQTVLLRLKEAEETLHNTISFLMNPLSGSERENLTKRLKKAREELEDTF